jgi:hypothetical protein
MGWISKPKIRKDVEGKKGEYYSYLKTISG